MNLTSILAAGRIGLDFTIVTIVATMAAGWAVGRMLSIDTDTSLLISAGTSICGGSAIVAVGSALKIDARAMSVALAIVFSLNAIALFIFPPLGHLIGLGERNFGLWAAIAIHDTSSVVGAAAKYGEEALAVATTVKLVRSLWILPLALALALIKRRKVALVGFPWFILFFIVAAAVRTIWPEQETLYRFIKRAALLGLTASLFFIGAGLTRPAIRAAGVRPMLQGIALWLAVATLGLAAVLIFGMN